MYLLKCGLSVVVHIIFHLTPLLAMIKSMSVIHSYPAIIHRKFRRIHILCSRTERKKRNYLTPIFGRMCLLLRIRLFQLSALDISIE